MTQQKLPSPKSWNKDFYREEFNALLFAREMYFPSQILGDKEGHVINDKKEVVFL